MQRFFQHRPHVEVTKHGNESRVASVDRETSHCKDVKPSSWRDLFIGEFNLQKVSKELEENNKRKRFWCEKQQEKVEKLSKRKLEKII